MYFNQENGTYWNNGTRRDAYAEFIRRATFLAFENVTGYSMIYGEDQWQGMTWNQAGITNYRACYVFDFRYPGIPNCPSVSVNPPAYNATYGSVALFCVVADRNETGFQAYLENVSERQEFMDAVDFYLNQIVRNNTPCCSPGQLDGTTSRRRLLQSQRRLLQSSSPWRPHTTKEIIFIPVVENGTLAFRQLPMGYQGMFVNAVWGDVVVLLLVTVSAVVVCAVGYWCCNREECYPGQKGYNKFVEHVDEKHGDKDYEEDEVYALPLNKK